jgi:hypothetical protein
MVGPLAPLSVEWCAHYDVLHCGMVEGWSHRTSCKQQRLPSTERVDDNEEEAAEYRSTSPPNTERFEEEDVEYRRHD